MHIILGLKNLEKPLGFKAPCALTLGNFDGFHVGHQKLIERVKAQCKKDKGQAVLMTFEPHPLKVLFPERNTKTILDSSEKMKIAESLGIDVYISEPFSRELSQLTPQDFFLRLVKAMDVKNIFVGHDFNFGKNRSGTLSELQTLCDENKIKLEILSPVKIDGEVVSSTLIRNFVSQGQIDKANLFLGRPFSIKGVIERGIGRGNKIGFPTANLFTTDNLLLATGVYVTLFGIAGQIYPSVTNVGYNPTFAEKHETPRIETHIFDFSENIYGKQAKVSFLSRLRGEIKFDSAQKLIEQINADVIKARSYRWPKN